MTQKAGWHETSTIVWGFLMLVLGTALLLDNLDVIRVGSIWRYWPLIPVVIGIGKLLAARTRKDWGEGIWWIFVGAWLYVSVFEVYGLGFRESWPLLLVAWGVSMVWNSLTGGSKDTRSSAQWNSFGGETRHSKGDSA